MRLENLYQNFGKSSPEEQAAYIAEYRLRRAKDLETVQIVPKKKPSSQGTTSKIDISDEEKAIMKMLGLKIKDVIALRSAASPVQDQEDDENSAAVLFGTNELDEEDD